MTEAHYTERILRRLKLSSTQLWSLGLIHCMKESLKDGKGHSLQIANHQTVRTSSSCKRYLKGTSIGYWTRCLASDLSRDNRGEVIIRHHVATQVRNKRKSAALSSTLTRLDQVYQELRYNRGSWVVPWPIRDQNRAHRNSSPVPISELIMIWTRWYMKWIITLLDHLINMIYNITEAIDV